MGGIVGTVGSLLARYATKAMLGTAAKAALRGTLDVAKKAIPHVIAHKLATTIARKRKRVGKRVTGSQTGAGKVVLSKLAWVVPIVQPNDVLKVNLYKSIASNNTIPVGFRRRQCETFTLPQARSTVWRLGVSSAPEKPQWVLVRLQTGKSGNQERNGAIFYHCNLTNMQVCLNHSRYPSANTATDFVKEQCGSIQVVLRFR